MPELTETLAPPALAPVLPHEPASLARAAGGRAAEQLVIEGGFHLQGTIRPMGNKNAALPMIAAALLTDEPVTLSGVPDIIDVHVMLQLVESLGASVQWQEPGRVRIHAQQITQAQPCPELCARLRASLLLAGPLLARAQRLVLPMPGGDFIGRRRIDTHLLAFRALGAEITTQGRAYHMSHSGLAGAPIFLDEASVGATENALMLAVLAPGETIIDNVACEPHVQDLCRLLQAMGASIEGIGSNRLRIQGAHRLHGASGQIGPDHIEIGSLMGLAAVTGSMLEITGVRPQELAMVRMTFARLGVRSSIEGDLLRVDGRDGCHIVPDEGGAVPIIGDGPWPAFPADLTSIVVASATQCHGMVMVHEKMFENRLFFVDKLVAMGARIILCDPHRAVIGGPSPLFGARLESPDIRAGMAMLLAACAAEGETTIGNVRQIDRGYERIEERLGSLGVRIRREASD